MSEVEIHDARMAEVDWSCSCGARQVHVDAWEGIGKDDVMRLTLECLYCDAVFNAEIPGDSSWESYTSMATIKPIAEACEP